MRDPQRRQLYIHHQPGRLVLHSQSQGLRSPIYSEKFFQIDKKRALQKAHGRPARILRAEQPAQTLPRNTRVPHDRGLVECESRRTREASVRLDEARALSHDEAGGVC